MKKIIAFMLLTATLFTLISCKSKKYEPVESTKEEKTDMIVFSYGKKDYVVEYELYRALFLNYKSDVDGGDPEAWNGESKQEYIDRINDIILDRASEIYSAFALCDEIGIDLYSKKINKQIEDIIRISIDGGTYNNMVFEGFDGDYGKYLSSLKELNLNYSVHVLLLRYEIALGLIEDHFIGSSQDNLTPDMTLGKLEYTRDDVKSFYYSDDCVRVMRASFQMDFDSLAEKTAGKFKEVEGMPLSSKEKEAEIRRIIINYCPLISPEEIEQGYPIGRYSADSQYRDLVNAAFALNIDEASDVINIFTSNEASYYVLYRVEKSDSHFEASYETIESVYKSNHIGTLISGIVNDMKASANYLDSFNNIDHSAIRME